MQKLTIGIAPNMSIEIESDDMREIIERANFWSQLPDKCPKCGEGVVYFYKTPKDNAYWGLICTGTPAHESNFGVYKDLSRGFYYKGEESWTTAYGYQEQGGQDYAEAGSPAGYTQRPPDNAPAQNDRFENHTIADVIDDPVAKSLGDMVTGKQLGMIQALGREIGISVEQECMTILSCKFDELSKRAASAFIAHLQELRTRRPEEFPNSNYTPPVQASAAPAPTQPPARTYSAPVDDDIPF